MRRLVGHCKTAPEGVYPRFAPGCNLIAGIEGVAAVPAWRQSEPCGAGLGVFGGPFEAWEVKWMEDADLDPIQRKSKPKDLEVMSIEALQEYIAGLEAEIERARAAIVAKEGHRNAADAIFKR